MVPYARKSWVKVLGLESWEVVRERVGKAQEGLPSPHTLVHQSKVIMSFSRASVKGLT